MLIDTLKRILAPFIGLTIFVFGNGLLNTLTTVRLHEDGFSPFMIGLIASGYYVGLVIGSFRIESFVVRVGHIRAYAAFASSLAVLCLVMGFWVNGIVWFLVRVACGYAIAGLFIVIESWFLSASESNMRGQVLSLYMVAYYGAYASGQYLLKLAPATGFELFALVSMLCSLSVLPLACTRSRTPEIASPEQMNLIKLFRISPSSFIGGFVGGQTNAVVSMLLPVYIQANGHEESLAHVMALTIMGGMFFQYPLGKLSDKIDRRLMLMMIFIVTGMIALLCYLTNPILAWYTEPLFFILGGAVFAIYPVSISLMCDNVEKDRTIAATQGMLLAYGIGSVTGPILAPLFVVNPNQIGLFSFMALVCFVTTLLLSGRIMVNSAVPEEEKQDYVPTPPVQSATVSELDPRGEGGEGSIYDKC